MNGLMMPSGANDIFYHVHWVNSFDYGGNSMNVFLFKNGKFIKSGHVSVGETLDFEDVTLSVIGGSSGSYGGYLTFKKNATCIYQSYGFNSIKAPDTVPVKIDANVKYHQYTLHHNNYETKYAVYKLDK